MTWPLPKCTSKNYVNQFLLLYLSLSSSTEFIFQLNIVLFWNLLAITVTLNFSYYYKLYGIHFCPDEIIKIELASAQIGIIVSCTVWNFIEHTPLKKMKSEVFPFSSWLLYLLINILARTNKLRIKTILTCWPTYGCESRGLGSLFLLCCHILWLFLISN